MALFGPPDIEKLKAKGNIEGLIKALGYQEDSDVRKGDVRKAAAEALGEIGDARAVEPLIKALGDEDWSMRRDAVKALGEIGDTRAVEPLIEALGDKLEYVRSAAVSALGKIGDPRAVEPLIKALGDDDKDVRVSAAEALDSLGWKPDSGEVGARYWIGKGKWNRCVSIGAPAVEPLIEALRHGDWMMQKAAAKALGEIGVPAVEQLIAALGDWDKDVRKAAAEALGEIGDEWVVEPLIKALRDDDKDVRSAAVSALGKIGDPRAVEPLIKALGDDDKDVLRSVAYVLGVIGDARAVEPLIEALRDKDKNMGFYAAKALGEIGDARAVEPLSEALGDKNEGGEVRGNCAEALRKIGEKTGDSNKAAKEALAKIEIAVSDLVDKMVAIYQAHPQGLGRTGSSYEEIRQIGQTLFDKGGMYLMRQAHALFASKGNVFGAARDLEYVWDGIGGWRG